MEFPGAAALLRVPKALTAVLGGAFAEALEGVDRLLNAERLLSSAPPRHDAAAEVILLCHEPIRWDLEEMERHLREPHFTGQPEKVRIFLRWFEGCFCPLVKLSHERTQRLLDGLLWAAPSLVPLSQDSSTDSSEAESRASSCEEPLGPCSSSSHSQLRGAAMEQLELLEGEWREAYRMMRDILGSKAGLLKAQPDDRPNAAAKLRTQVEELGVVLRRCMAVEEQALLPWAREREESEAQELNALLDAELQAQADSPPMGWTGLSLWLPWVMHSLERWRSPKEALEFRGRLPWYVSGLCEYVWEPLYISNNWALLQSMADPLEDEDTAGWDDGL